MTEEQRIVVNALRKLCTYENTFEAKTESVVRVQFQYGDMNVDVIIHPSGRLEDNRPDVLR